jgi:hypothetical protein
MRLGINHITKEEFLPTFFTAHQQTMTMESITSGFKATDLVLFDLERVLAGLEPVTQAYPSSRSSQASWNPTTPKTISGIKN